MISLEWEGEKEINDDAWKADEEQELDKKGGRRTMDKKGGRRTMDKKGGRLNQRGTLELAQLGGTEAKMIGNRKT